MTPNAETRAALDEARLAKEQRAHRKRLQQLREEFEAALTAEDVGNRLQHADKPEWVLDVDGVNVFSQLTVEQAAHGRFEAALYIGLVGQKRIGPIVVPEPIATSARRYIIARDFTEFDPQRADMLWKLANGSAL